MTDDNDALAIYNDRLTRAVLFERVCVRSPEAFFDDSIFSPPLLPRMLRNPRTVWRCQPVLSMISVSVAPLGRGIKSMMSAFLFARRASGRASALGRRDFFAGLALALFADLRVRLGLAEPRSDVTRRSRRRIACVRAHCVFLLPLVAVVARGLENNGDAQLAARRQPIYPAPCDAVEFWPVSIRFDCFPRDVSSRSVAATSTNTFSTESGLRLMESIPCSTRNRANSG